MGDNIENHVTRTRKKNLVCPTKRVNYGLVESVAVVFSLCGAFSKHTRDGRYTANNLW